MCLAVPGKIIERTDDKAVIDVRGNKMRASLALVPDAKPGDYVLLHAGFAITRISQKEAAETQDTLTEIEQGDFKSGQ